MDIDKAKLKAFAAEHGADLIGFAPAERFDGLAPALDPRAVFPDLRTVILLGRRVTRGTLRGVEEGSNLGDYGFFGSSWLEDEFVAQTCYDVVCAIENEGWEACPVFPNPPEMGGSGVSVREGEPAPNVTPDFRWAAVACGLAVIGRSGELLTPRFGPRVRFQMILTDAAIEPDKMLDYDPCEGCAACAEICPLKAMDAGCLEEIPICGRSFKVFSCELKRCRECRNGARPNRLMASARPDRLPALCGRTCVDRLEKSGRVSNTFERPFRTKEPWGFDRLGERVRFEGEAGDK